MSSSSTSTSFNMDSPDVVKMMVLKKLSEEDIRPEDLRRIDVKDMEMLDDIEIPPEQDELIDGLAKLFKSTSKSYLTFDELREFEILLERKGIVEKGGLLRNLKELQNTHISDLTEEGLEIVKKFSLEDHILPAVENLRHERLARQKAMAVGKSVSEKERREKEQGKESTASSASLKRRISEKIKIRLREKAELDKGEEVTAKEQKTSMQAKNSKDSLKASTKMITAKEHKPKNSKDSLKASTNKMLDDAKKCISQRLDELERFNKVSKFLGRGPAANLRGTELEEERNEREYRKENHSKINDKSRAVKVKGTSLPKTRMLTFREALTHMANDEAPEGLKIPVGMTERVNTFRFLLYSAEKLVERPGPDVEGPPVVTYKIALHCIIRGTRNVHTLALWEVPRTGYVLKDRIQRQFQIPTSYQHDLSYAGKSVEDSTVISSIGLKPGGKLELSFISDGELEDVRVIMRWYVYVLRFGMGRHCSIFTGMPAEYYMICHRGIAECLAETLANTLFLPWGDPIKAANRDYFIQEKGVEGIVELYENLIMENWRTMVLTLKLMEAGCILVLSSLGSNVLSQQKVISLDGHGFVLQSFLRVLMRPRGVPLVDTSGAPGPQKNNNFMLKEIMDACITFFINYRECQEVHLDICSKNNSVDQVLATAHSPSFSVEQAQSCLCLLACCMHSTDTHKWLCRNHTLEGIADTVRVHRERGVNRTELKLLQYYAVVTLAHLVISSVHVMSRKVTEKLVLFMEDFLRSTPPSFIMMLEQAKHPRYGWSPFLPYFKVLLSPPKVISQVRSSVNSSESFTISRLVDLSLEVMLFVVQVMATSNPYKARRQLLEERILTYALCLSANVPRHLLSNAKAVVAALRSDSSKAVPIPRLSIMAQAKLATVHFGLKKVMDRSADELKVEVSPPPPRSLLPLRASMNTDNFNPLFCIISM